MAWVIGLSSLAQGQTFQTIYSFQNSDGANPSVGLTQGSDGVFYGTTANGGTNNQGTIFKLTTNGVLTTLVSFNGNNGAHPSAELIQDSSGNFYGATSDGGTDNQGTIFKMSTNGVLTEFFSFPLHR